MIQKILILFAIASIAAANDYDWQTYSGGTIPSTAVIVHGDGNDAIYVGRVNTTNGLNVGVLRSGDSNIYTSWNPSNSSSLSLEILCSAAPEKLQWIVTNTNTYAQDLVGYNPVLAGDSPSLYSVARAWYDNEVVVGHVWPGSVIHFAHEGSSVSARAYSVLVNL